MPKLVTKSTQLDGATNFEFFNDNLPYSELKILLIDNTSKKLNN